MYKSFSKTLMEYEEQKYNEWVSNALHFVENMMKRNILHVVFKKTDGKFLIQ